MSERKCLQRYHCLERQYKKKTLKYSRKKSSDAVRFMIPFDIICKNCSWIFRQGKKVNAFKEVVLSENYLSIKVFRFYFKCPKCIKGVSMKTDPKNSYYRPELNCKRFCD